MKPLSLVAALLTAGCISEKSKPSEVSNLSSIDNCLTIVHEELGQTIMDLFFLPNTKYKEGTTIRAFDLDNDGRIDSFTVVNYGPFSRDTSSYANNVFLQKAYENYLRESKK